MSLPVRLSDRGPILPVGFRAIAARQNPNAVQVVTSAAPLVVLTQVVQLEDNDGAYVWAAARGLNLDGAATQSLTLAILAVFTPTGGAPGAPMTLESATDLNVAIAGDGKETIMGAFFPVPPAFVAVGPGTLAVSMQLTASAVAGFDVGSRPNGGCDLCVAVVDLDNGAFTFTVATP